MFRTTVDANQKVSPDFAVRANLMYDTHGIAGRDITESERWGGLISATGRLSDSVKITLDYYRYRNDATPDWGVPARDIDNVPITERRRLSQHCGSAWWASTSSRRRRTSSRERWLSN